MKPFSSVVCIVTIISMTISINLEAIDTKGEISTSKISDLIWISGGVRHDPDDGIPPPSRSELIGRARQKALEKLNNQEEFKQISEWKDEIFCIEVFKGSSQCYKGSASSEATFIAQKDYENIWQYRTYGIVRSETKNESIYEDAYQEAIKRAKFFCGKDVVLPPTNVYKDLDHWWCKYSYHYVATFQCKKYDRYEN